MSDTTPLYPTSTLPSYTESQGQPNAAQPVVTEAPKEAPPPYTPPQGSRPAGYQSYAQVVDSPIELVAVLELGPSACHLQCPSCGNFIYTDTVHRPGALTYIASFFCFLFCVICTCVPCFINSCLDVDHFCPRCNYHFGTFTRM